MTIRDVTSMTLMLLEQIEVRGEKSVTAMQQVMSNLKAINNALADSEKETEDNDCQDK